MFKNFKSYSPNFLVTTVKKKTKKKGRFGPHCQEIKRTFQKQKFLNEILLLYAQLYPSPLYPKVKKSFLFEVHFKDSYGDQQDIFRKCNLKCIPMYTNPVVPKAHSLYLTHLLVATCKQQKPSGRLMVKYNNMLTPIYKNWRKGKCMGCLSIVSYQLYSQCRLELL